MKHPSIDTYFSDHPNYEDMFDHCGYKRLEFVIFGDYQGDYAVIIKRDNKYGFVVIGYGSCSGCDALEAVYDEPEKYQALFKSIERDIHWGTPAELVERIDSDIPEWYNHDKGYQENMSTLRRCLRLLEMSQEVSEATK